MTQQQTVVPGERKITWRPTLEPEKRWEGTIANPDYAERVWQHPTIEETIDRMDAELGTIPDDDYMVVE